MVSLNLNLPLPIWLPILILSPPYSALNVKLMPFSLISAVFLTLFHMLLHKLAHYGLSVAYINWFHSYLTNRLSSLSWALSQPFRVISGVPQGSVLGPLLFEVFINDLCNVIKFSNYLLSVDDITIFQAVKDSSDCFLLQIDIDSICGWCTLNYMKINVSKPRVISFTRKTNTIRFEYKLCGSHINHMDTIKDYMKINVSKTRVISFTRKTNMIPFEYKLCGSHINHMDTIKDLGIILDPKLDFHAHVDYIFSQARKLLSLICATTFSFSSTDSLFMLYFTLVRSKLEYACCIYH
jgi:hypothetical protein